MSTFPSLVVTAWQASVSTPPLILFPASRQFVLAEAAAAGPASSLVLLVGLPSLATDGFPVPPALAPIAGSVTATATAESAPAQESRLPLLRSPPIVELLSSSEVQTACTPSLLFGSVGHSLPSLFVLLQQWNVLSPLVAAAFISFSAFSCSAQQCDC